MSTEPSPKVLAARQKEWSDRIHKAILKGKLRLERIGEYPNDMTIHYCEIETAEVIKVINEMVAPEVIAALEAQASSTTDALEREFKLIDGIRARIVAVNEDSLNFFSNGDRRNASTSLQVAQEMAEELQALIRAERNKGEEKAE